MCKGILNRIQRPKPTDIDGIVTPTGGKCHYGKRVYLRFKVKSFIASLSALRIGLEVYLLTILVWTVARLLTEFTSVSSLHILYPFTGAAALWTVLYYGGRTTDGWFPAWPTPDSTVNIAVLCLGYNTTVGMGIVLGALATTIIQNHIVGLGTVAVLTVWFFKHLHFILTFEG